MNDKFLSTMKELNSQLESYTNYDFNSNPTITFMTIMRNVFVEAGIDENIVEEMIFNTEIEISPDLTVTPEIKQEFEKTAKFFLYFFTNAIKVFKEKGFKSPVEMSSKYFSKNLSFVLK